MSAEEFFFKVGQSLLLAVGLRSTINDHWSDALFAGSELIVPTKAQSLKMALALIVPQSIFPGAWFSPWAWK